MAASELVGCGGDRWTARRAVPEADGGESADPRARGRKTPHKTQFSARELAELVVNMTRVEVEVHPDPAYGWRPTVFTTPSQAVNAQNAAERAAEELRALYDLREE
jgi:hypothetical protein